MTRFLAVLLAIFTLGFGALVALDDQPPIATHVATTTSVPVVTHSTVYTECVARGWRAVFIEPNGIASVRDEACR